MNANHVATRPLVSILLLAYNQERTIEQAIESALSQTYSPIEIIISDDASSDGTFVAIQKKVSQYAGQHRLIVNRNQRNLGIGAHLSHLVSISSGELLFIAAGDDKSLPKRCESVVSAWLSMESKPDLIASALVEMDDSGCLHEAIVPTDLSSYRSISDWVKRPPFIVGAAHTWTRRLFDKFGPLPMGVVAEDLIMVFRAIGAGGAISLPEPLVAYGCNGLSSPTRKMCAKEVISAALKNAHHTVVEYEQLLRDAQVIGQFGIVQSTLTAKLERERFIIEVFGASGILEKISVALRSRSVPSAARLRMLMYAAWPSFFGVFFFLKRLLSSRR